MSISSKNAKYNTGINLWKISTFILLFSLIGLILWSVFTGITPQKLKELTQHPDRVSALIEELQVSNSFKATQQQIQKYIDSDYIGSKPDSQTYEDSLLKGYVGALGDKYSEYLTQSDYQAIQESLNSSFSGIGISFEYFGSYIEVQTVFPDTPAEKKGLKVGDKIIAVDDTTVSTLGSSDLVRSKIVGAENSTVKLTVVSTDVTQDIVIERKKINFPVITYEKNGSVGIIHVSSFGDQIDTEMKKVAQQIRSDSEIKNIILDLTNNGGGYLNGALDLVSYFSKPDTTVVINKTKKVEEILKTTVKENNLQDYPVVVAVNRFTASAAEITAGALQDTRGVKAVGSKTYGKGVVQQIFPLSSGNAVKITIAEWLTPNRRSINNTGINPDFYIEKDEVKTILERFSWEENILK